MKMIPILARRIKITKYNMKIISFIITCVFVITFPIALITQAESGMIDIKDAIAIVSTGMGVRIIVDGDIKGQIPFELENQSPKQIKERLEQALNEIGYSWVAEGNVVYITKDGQRIRSLFGKKLPLSYYIDVISRNNLFRPIGAKPIEIKTDLILTGIFGFGENSKAIIEDKISQRSYYVSVGETIGSSKVLEIREDSVVLSSPNGQSVLKIQQNKQ
ncbi:TPA: hypothetical protein ENX78_15095 [Candidatus Poribacteria bacterium]|nr:hypothetical protein [Candidatus Poribacteria bacterium]